MASTCGITTLGLVLFRPCQETSTKRPKASLKSFALLGDTTTTTYLMDPASSRPWPSTTMDISALNGQGMRERGELHGTRSPYSRDGACVIAPSPSATWALGVPDRLTVPFRPRTLRLFSRQGGSFERCWRNQ